MIEIVPDTEPGRFTWDAETAIPVATRCEHCERWYSLLGSDWSYHRYGGCA